MSKFNIAKYKDISTEDGKLHIYSTVNMSRSHGPGRRFSIWTQGCFKRCPGCINPQMQDASQKRDTISNEALVQKIADAKNSVLDIEGITIQGGEPFLQAKSLANFLKLLKEKLPEINVIVFSGYTLMELKRFNSEAINYILSNIDVLIDGVFEENKFDNERVAGSKNQNIYHLGDRRLEDADFTRHGGDIIIRAKELRFVRTGVPRK